MAAEDLAVFGQPVGPSLLEEDLTDAGCSEWDDSGFDLDESLYESQKEGDQSA
jgi:hypothetical protein